MKKLLASVYAIKDSQDELLEELEILIQEEFLYQAI